MDESLEPIDLSESSSKTLVGVGDEVLLANPTEYATHTLIELINLLKEIKLKNGNLPVVYWDQDSYVEMTPEYLIDLLIIDDKVFLAFGGFHVNGTNFSTFSKDGNTDPTNYVTHNLNKLITLLMNIESTGGNLPVVYWDQDSYIKMIPEYLTDVITINNKSFLAFGGFHVNGMDFCQMAEEV